MRARCAVASRCSLRSTSQELEYFYRQSLCGRSFRLNEEDRRGNKEPDPHETSDTIAGLLDRLPSAPPSAEDDWRIERLSDQDLRELERINTVARDTAAPLWEPDVVAPENTQRERAALRFAEWLDARADSWTFGGPTAQEMQFMRGELSGLLYPLIPHHLYRQVVSDEVLSAMERKFNRPGSDVRAVAPTEAERQEIMPPPEIPRLNDAGITSHSPPFSFGSNKPQ